MAQAVVTRPHHALPPVPVTSVKTRLLRFLLALLCVAVLTWAYRGAEMRPYDLYTYRANMLNYAKGFVSPDFVNWPDYLRQMVVTVQIAIWGTLLAIVGAVWPVVIGQYRPGVAPPAHSPLDGCHALHQ